MSRFDYVKYDDTALADQASAKIRCQNLEREIEAIGYSLGPDQMAKGCGRAKSLALTKLEECYAWIGKAIRDDQIARNGSAPLQEERGNE